MKRSSCVERTAWGGWHVEATTEADSFGVEAVRHDSEYVCAVGYVEYLWRPACGVCWLIWFCISYKTHSGSNKYGFISFMIDNMHYVIFRI